MQPHVSQRTPSRVPVVVQFQPAVGNARAAVACAAGVQTHLRLTRSEDTWDLQLPLGIALALPVHAARSLARRILDDETQEVVRR